MPPFRTLSSLPAIWCVPRDTEGFYAARKEVFDQKYPSGDYPPNTLLIIDRLVREEFLIEIEAIAALP